MAMSTITRWHVQLLTTYASTLRFGPQIPTSLHYYVVANRDLYIHDFAYLDAYVTVYVCGYLY
jgi:hypothetical protein